MLNACTTRPTTQANGGAGQRLDIRGTRLVKVVASIAERAVRIE
jgi:hypothetical protein